jgi:chemotaxis protein methyltransferase CheR
VSPLDYEFLCKLLKDQSGLALAGDKQYLVESRLLPLARKAGLASLADLVSKLRDGGDRLAVDVVHAMTTNESFFFRDKIPFDHFRDTIMPALLAARAPERRIRIWCAAASTGQEPYSLAICLNEMKDRIAGWRIEIVGTDLSTAVLEKAKAGLYTQFEVQRGLPIQMLVKYFAQVGEMWQIAADIRAMVQYRPLNLLADFTHLGSFDLVFCRNVLIYFDQDTKIGVLNRIARSTAPHGYLVLGAAETVVGLTDAFKPAPDRRGLYAPAPPASNAGLAARVAAMAPRVATVAAVR